MTDNEKIEWRYNFPAYVANPTTWAEQVEKMRSELEEVQEALQAIADAPAEKMPEAVHAFAVEVGDYMHSGETLLHSIEEYGVDAGEIREEVEAKNRTRGYYGESK
jgi:hypothetical protein